MDTTPPPSDGSGSTPASPPSAGTVCELTVGSFWNGPPLPLASVAQLSLRLEAETLYVRFEAPYFGDPAPEAAPGSTEALWNYEVVELFLLGDHGRYLELEFGPHGHYLAIRLQGCRRALSRGHALQYRSMPVAPKRYRGEAHIPRALLPSGALRGNAYLIHASGAACHSSPGDRCYHAHQAVPATQPDFHQLNRFTPLAFRRP